MEVVFAPVLNSDNVRDYVLVDGCGKTFEEVEIYGTNHPQDGLVARAIEWCQAAGWVESFALRDAPDLERLWPPVATTEGDALGAMYTAVTGEKPGKKKDATLRAAILERRASGEG